MMTLINKDWLIQVSAFSGLIGALLTQAITGVLAYFSDKRKARNELRSTYRNRQADIAENFYFVTGEKLAVVNKNIDYWKHYNNSRSDKSLDFLNQELKKLTAYMEKLDNENWKYNLAGLYFDISLSNEQVIASNLHSKALYLKILDLTDAIRHSLPESKDDLYRLYEEAIEELCSHYSELAGQMAADMAVVKKGLLSQLTKN